MAQQAVNESKGEAYHKLNDGALLDSLKNDDPKAFIEIVERYQGLVFKYARSFHVRSEDQREWVSDLLNDVILSLIKPGAISPDSLSAYFARACRNKAYMLHRSESRRAVRENSASTSLHTSEVVVESVCSESMLKQARAMDVERTELSPALAKFVGELEKVLDSKERQLLDWYSESVPLRLIAEWCGITRSGASHRIGRLKKRLQDLAPSIVAGFTTDEQIEIERFLVRAREGKSNVR